MQKFEYDFFLWRDKMLKNRCLIKFEKQSAISRKLRNAEITYKKDQASQKYLNILNSEKIVSFLRWLILAKHPFLDQSPFQTFQITNHPIKHFQKSTHISET